MGFNYLENKDLKKALDEYLGILSKSLEFSDEEAEVSESLNRITSEAVYANISNPHYSASAMDGIAVRSSLTFGATETTPVILSEGKNFIRLDTGDPIPENFDTVIMIEDVIELGNGKIKIINASSPYQNIRQIGEDICKGEMILPSNTKIEAASIGALIAGGISRLKVFKKPVIGIIPTGDEIILPTESPKIGEIIEFNSKVFSALITNWGGTPRVFDILKDDFEKIKNIVLKAVSECDIVLINAGSSAGRDDYTKSVIEKLGTVITHGIAIKPGKPTILGIIKNKSVIGIPGYPVSGIIVMEKIVKNIMSLFLKNNIAEKVIVKAKLTRKIVSSLKYEEFIRVKLGLIDGQLTAIPLSGGAGVITSFVKADGLLRIPQNTEGLEAGTETEVELLKNFDDIKNTLTVTGSHDPLIDEISDIVRKKNPKSFVSSSHIGSIGGIMSLKRNECHIAPIHLLDEKTGIYNESYIKKYFENEKIVLIKGVKRLQGLIVQKGNPKNIFSIKDLVQKGISFVNRQKGSGTRILLDYLLKKNDIDPKSIYGYEREEFTHLSVAVQIANQSADVGLGIYSAAKIYGLDFISVCEEDYDFIIAEKNLELEIVKNFLEILKSDELKRRLDLAGGYTIKNKSFNIL